jgi:outer membrane lipoprotein SlyB
MRAAFLLLPLALAACGPRFSPDAYATRAVQQANRVEQGVIIGRRTVRVQMEGTTGAATGGAAGGIIGSQAPGGNMAGAIGAVGGALVGGLFGTAAERVAGDTTAFEYIVRKTNGELVSVTQRDEQALDVGLRVLVIAGAQARIVADYTLPGQPAPTSLPEEATAPAAAPVAAPAPATLPTIPPLPGPPPSVPLPPAPPMAEALPTLLAP